MIVQLVDGTNEFFRHFYCLRRFIWNSPYWTRARVLCPAQTGECRQAGTTAPGRV